jgi:hypothetical protein
MSQRLRHYPGIRISTSRSQLSQGSPKSTFFHYIEQRQEGGKYLSQVKKHLSFELAKFLITYQYDIIVSSFVVMARISLIRHLVILVG